MNLNYIKQKVKMGTPIVCVECGYPLGDKYELFREARKKCQMSDLVYPLADMPKTDEKTDSLRYLLKALGVTKSCCITHMMVHNQIFKMR
jgi:DNA-directed RNA polymerase subunit N (RpoN/RPB10)